MEKSINLKTFEFKKELYNLINKSELPIVNVYLIFEKVKHEIDCAYAEAIAKESAACSEEQKENKNDSKN